MGIMDFTLEMAGGTLGFGIALDSYCFCGFEAGVIVQFVLDHYYALPDVSIFMQDRPEQHNPHWLHWSQCLRHNISYAPMTNARMARLFKANAQTDPGTDADDTLSAPLFERYLYMLGYDNSLRQ